MAADDKEELDGIDKWHDQVKDTGTDFVSMATAFLVVFFFRCLIAGEPVSIDGELGLDPSKGWILIALAYLFLFLTAGVHAAHHYIKGFCMDYLSTSAATSAAFMLIFGYMWRFGKHGHSEVISLAVVATSLSINAIIFLVVLSLVKGCVTDTETKAFKAAFTGLALAVGLSWEKVFDAGMDGLTKEIALRRGLDEHSRTCHSIFAFLSLGIMLVVLPAWMLYIMPKAPDNDDVRTKYSNFLADGGTLPLIACCFFWRDDPDEYEEAELASDIE